VNLVSGGGATMDSTVTPAYKGICGKAPVRFRSKARGGGWGWLGPRESDDIFALLDYELILIVVT